MQSRSLPASTITASTGVHALRTSIRLSNASRASPISNLTNLRKLIDAKSTEMSRVVDDGSRREKENLLAAAQTGTKRRRAAAVAAETKILESSRKSRRTRKSASLEEDDGFVFTRVRNIVTSSFPEADESPIALGRGTQVSSENLKDTGIPHSTQTGAVNFGDVQSERILTKSGRPQGELLNTDSRSTSNVETSLRQEDSQTTIISLPLSDTPIIRRNQQLRQQNGGSRRSSLGMRGKRASSLSKGLVAVPHSDIETAEFYKHLDSDLPDPHRMKQLLVWCANRSMAHMKQADKKKQPAASIARIITEELVKDLTDGKISTSWWNRPNDNSCPKKPNPLNVANSAKIDEFKTRLERLRTEKKTWADAENDMKPILPPLSNVDVTLLLPKEASFLSRYESASLADESTPKLAAIQRQTKEVELSVDTLRHDLYQVKSVSASAANYADQVLKDVSKSLEQIRSTTQKIGGTDGLEIRDVLRTLSKVDRL
ncbi:Mis12-Mtw1 protein family-domain-containing protein [Limtongia smithiae]|uniref:Mis12-Mtw1 protein family-domain-containing protein n=1 Tax=Limtongia smithiae TaxID=1125753 RepID=UPI0034CF0E98